MVSDYLDVIIVKYSCPVVIKVVTIFFTFLDEHNSVGYYSDGTPLQQEFGQNI